MPLIDRKCTVTAHRFPCEP